jgi:hypothetical protein
MKVLVLKLQLKVGRQLGRGRLDNANIRDLRVIIGVLSACVKDANNS